MHHNLREGDIHAISAEQGEKVLIQPSPGGKYIRLLRLRVEPEDDGTVAERLNTHEDGRREIEIPVLVIYFIELWDENLSKLRDIGIIGDADVADGQRIVPGPVLKIADVRIVDDLQVAAGILDDGGADADAADRAPEIIQDNDVADAVFSFKDDEEAGDDILNQALGAESDDQADDADAGQHRAGIHPEDAEAPQQGNNDRKLLYDALEQVRHGGGPAFCFSDHLQKHGEKGADNPDDQHRGNQHQHMGYGDARISPEEKMPVKQGLHGAGGLFRQRQPFGMTEQDNQDQ